MSRIQMTQAVAADYADAMLVARRAKSVLFFFLALVLLIQLGVFFVVRYVPVVKIRPEPVAAATDSTSATPTTSPTDAPAVATGASAAIAKWNWPKTLRFWINSVDFLGIVLSFVMPVILLLIIVIMLVGRLVGVSHVTSAFCWSIVFLVILFPWQTLISSHAAEDAGSAVVSPGAGAYEKPEITFPGAMYTFSELSRDYKFESADYKNDLANIVLKWMRFAGWPVVELIILLMVQARSGRGLRFALGEADVPVIVGPGE